MLRRVGNWNGLYKISSAPARSARLTRSSTLQAVVQPVLITTGMFRVDRFAFSRAVTSSPFSSGKRISIMIKSGRILKAFSMASGPLDASKTSWPRVLIKVRTDSRKVLSLSTINIFFDLSRMTGDLEHRGCQSPESRLFGNFSPMVTLLRYFAAKIASGEMAWGK